MGVYPENRMLTLPSRRQGSAVSEAKNHLILEKLEPRLLLSADLLAGSPVAEMAPLTLLRHLSLEAEDDPRHQPLTFDPPLLPEHGTSSEPDILAMVQPDRATADQSIDLTVLQPLLGQTLPRTEVIFVDAGVEDADTLIQDVGGSATSVVYHIVHLDAGLDGLRQITESLQNLDGVAALHFISHGSDQGVQLGNTWLDHGTASAQRATIAAWADSLTAEADLLLYGCDLAGSESGENLVRLLGDLTGADVAASTDRTGAASGGGDWDLEYTQGQIESELPQTLASSSWQGTLFASDGLLLSIKDDRNDIPDVGAVEKGQVLQFSGANLSYDPGGTPVNTTSGTYSIAFDLSVFDQVGAEVNVDAFHEVKSNITIGTGTTINLQAGDLLISTNESETLTSTNALTVGADDLFVFRPDTPGNYSSGTFTMLLEGITSFSTDLNAITLIETDTVVGESTNTLSAGSFLFSQGPILGLGANTINLYTPTDVGAGVTAGTTQALIFGSEIGFGFSTVIDGLDLVENATTVDGTTLTSGMILASIASSDTVGDNNLSVARQDIFALGITKTTLVSGFGNAEATAILIFDGDDVGLTAGGHDVNAFSLLTDTSNTPPSATNLSSTSNYTEGASDVAITNIVVSDSDANDIITATLTLANPAAGALSANDGATYTGATGTWTVTGTVSVVNTALANVVFQPATDNDQNTTIAVEIDDGNEDLSPPLTGTISLNVTPVNDPPTAVNLSANGTYDERDQTIAIPDVIIADVDTDDVVTATLTLSSPLVGTLTTSGAATFNATTGVWSITSNVSNVNAALAGVQLQRASEGTQTYTIAVSIDDGDEDGSGPLTGTLTLTADTPLEEEEPTPPPAAPAEAPKQAETAEAVEEETEAAEDEVIVTEEDEESEDETEAAEETAETEDTETFTDFERVLAPEQVNGVEVNVSGVQLQANFLPAEVAHVSTDTDSNRGGETERSSSETSETRILAQSTMEELSNPLQLVKAEAFLNELDKVREKIVVEYGELGLIASSSLGVSAGFSVGYAAWLARSGLLLSSALSALPAWRFVDPLPVLSGGQAGASVEDTETLETIVEQEGQSGNHASSEEAGQTPGERVRPSESGLVS